MRVVLLVIGLLLLGGGLALGLIPSSATIAVNETAISVARADSYSCGSPWLVDQQSPAAEQKVADLAAGVATVQGTPTVAEDAAGLCTTALGSRGMFGAVLAGLGALTLLGLGLVLVAVRRGPNVAPGATGETPAA